MNGANTFNQYQINLNITKMSLKKLNAKVFYHNAKDLMIQLHLLQSKIAEGAMRGINDQSEFECLYVEEIPYRIENIDGQKCRIFSSKMNSDEI